MPGANDREFKQAAFYIWFALFAYTLVDVLLFLGGTANLAHPMGFAIFVAGSISVLSILSFVAFNNWKKGKQTWILHTDNSTDFDGLNESLISSFMLAATSALLLIAEFTIFPAVATPYSPIAQLFSNLVLIFLPTASIVFFGILLSVKVVSLLSGRNSSVDDPPPYKPGPPPVFTHDEDPEGSNLQDNVSKKAPPYSPRPEVQQPPETQAQRVGAQRQTAMQPGRVANSSDQGAYVPPVSNVG